MRRRQVGEQFVLFVFEAEGVVQGLVEVIGAARGDDHEEQRHRGKGDVQRILAEAADSDGEHDRPGIQPEGRAVGCQHRHGAGDHPGHDEGGK